jgi:hypothetical protein
MAGREHGPGNLRVRELEFTTTAGRHDVGTRREQRVESQTRIGSRLSALSSQLFLNRGSQANERATSRIGRRIVGADGALVSGMLSGRIMRRLVLRQSQHFGLTQQQNAVNYARPERMLPELLALTQH